MGANATPMNSMYGGSMTQQTPPVMSQPPQNPAMPGQPSIIGSIPNSGVSAPTSSPWGYGPGFQSTALTSNGGNWQQTGGPMGQPQMSSGPSGCPTCGR